MYSVYVCYLIVNWKSLSFELLDAQNQAIEKLNHGLVENSNRIYNYRLNNNLHMIFYFFIAWIENSLLESFSYPDDSLLLNHTTATEYKLHKTK